MNNLNQFDQIIKDKMEGFSEAPPAYLWDKIAAEISTAPIAIPFYKTLQFKVIAAAASLILLLGISWWLPDFIYQQNQTISKQADKISNSKSLVVAKTSSTSNQSTPTSKTNTDDANNAVASSPKKELTEKISLHQPLLSQNKTQKTSKNNQPTAEPKLNQTPEVEPTRISAISPNTTDELLQPAPALNANQQQIAATNLQNETLEISQPLNLPVSTGVKSESETTAQPIISKEINSSVNEPINEEPQNLEQNTTVEPALSNVEPQIAEEPLPIKDPNQSFQPSQSRKFNQYGLGVHYGLERIQLDQLHINTNHLDASINYRNLNFIAQSGIGLSYSKDRHDYYMEFVRNDYLATQMRFDSVNFVMDTNGDVIIVPVNPYYVDVYDSINHKHSDSYHQRYYSLRIPLMLGFQKDYTKTAAFVKAGLAYNFIIIQRSSNLYQPGENARLISVLDYGNNPRKSHLEYMISAGVIYRINRALHFHAELMGKYFQQNFYQNYALTQKHPWSMEARLGLVYAIN
jgi:hypothetical protein